MLYLTRDVEEEEITVPPSTTSSTTVITAVLVVEMELEEELAKIAKLLGDKNTQQKECVFFSLHVCKNSRACL